MQTDWNKIILRWLAVMIMLAAPSWLCSCDGCQPTHKSGKVEQSDGGKSNEKPKTEADKLKEDNAKLKDENAKLKDDNSKLKTQIDNPPKVVRSPFLSKIVIGALIGSGILVVWLLFFRPRPSQNPVIADSSTTCPRCGWKISIGDTVCRNPDCKTRFK